MRVLLVEVDPTVVERIRSWLDREEFDIHVVESPDDVVPTPSEHFDVVLIGQPDGARLQLCRKLRLSDRRVRLMMLTPQDSREQAIAALEAGADDVLSRESLSVRELAARLRALARRKGASDDPAVMDAGPLTIDRQNRRVLISGEPVQLSQAEFNLLAVLAARPGRVFDRQSLVLRVWGHQPLSPRTLDSAILRLRSQLGPAGALVQTVRGVGYRLAGRAVVQEEPGAEE